MNKTIFLDRDGTLIEEVNYLHRVEDLRFFSYTDEAVRLLKRNGFQVVLVTNQSGIGRGVYSESDMHVVNQTIQERLSEKLDAIFFCPHLPDAGCRCRKPNLGMIEDACRLLPVDLSRSWMIGDKKLDVETGRNAGIRSVLVKTGYGAGEMGRYELDADIVAENLLEAALRIIDQDNSA